jgi:hypothetical protein
MKRMKDTILTLAITMLALTLCESAWANPVTLDFTSLFGGHGSGTQGDTLTFNGLTITARTGVNVNTGSPLEAIPPARNGAPGDVYWGLLGNLDVPNQSYFGLGVLAAGQNGDAVTGPITKSEALIFRFDTPQQVDLQLKDLQILGLNALANGGTGAPADNMRVYFKVASGQTGAVDINAGAIPIFAPDYVSAIRYGLQYVTYADERVTAFAVEQTYGNTENSLRKFGVGRVTYEAPEPASLLLLGSGLVGMASLAWKRTRP